MSREEEELRHKKEQERIAQRKKLKEAEEEREVARLCVCM
jgi:hypothetical protein